MNGTGTTAHSGFERLLEHWADLAHWPSAKKTALLTGGATLFHIVVPTIALSAYAWGAPGLVDVARLARLFGMWVVVCFLIFVVSLVVARRGREGRWTVYLLIFGYGAFVVATVAQFGIASSPWLAVIPLVILAMAIFFDLRAGRASLLYGCVLLLAMSALELYGKVPLAPVILQRTLEASLAPGWYIGSYIVVFSVLLYVFFLVQLAVWARDNQQKRLEAAHQLLSQTSTELARANEMISRYVASQVAEKIRSGQYDEVSRHDRRKLTLFFSDIKDFTMLAERLEPEDLSARLNEYLSEMSTIANRHGGTIDKFVGDAIMILFGAPVPIAENEQALRAVHMGAEMQERLAALRDRWVRDGMEYEVAIRIGINTGQATVGNFGSPERMDYTAIGRQVNLAARLQAHCEPGRILVSHATYVLIRDVIPCAPKGEIQVKGFEHPVRVYEVAGFTGAQVTTVPSNSTPHG